MIIEFRNTKQEALLLTISQAIRDTLSNMTNEQLEKLMKSPLKDFRQDEVRLAA
jgi:hypothetical protein